jgi:hypothetical protein
VNPSGSLTLAVDVPATASGYTIWYQIFRPGGCVLSNLVVYAFP